MINVSVGGSILADFKTFDSPLEGVVYVLLSNLVVGDRSYRTYYYNSTSTATPDDDNIIENTVAGGRYLKLPVDLKVTSTGTGAPTFNAATGVLNIPSNTLSPIISTAARTLNSNFTISTTKYAEVAYSIALSVTNPLLIGSSSASVFLEYSLNSGSSWTIASQASNTSSVGITVTVAITNIQTSVLTGTIPVNALVRLRSTTTGTGSVTFVSTQEVVF